jgi:hypothetical protein
MGYEFPATAEDLVPFANYSAAGMVHTIRTGLEQLHLAMRAQIEQLGVPFPLERFTFSAFAWAWWVVGARGIVREGRTALVPLVDLFNYKRGERAVAFSAEAKLYTVAPALGAAAGEQLYTGFSANFTKLDSWGWYSWTGFVPPEIPFALESLPITCELPLGSGDGTDAGGDSDSDSDGGGAGDPALFFIAERLAALKKLGFSPEGHVFRLAGSFESPPEMGPFLRFAGIGARETLPAEAAGGGEAARSVVRRQLDYLIKHEGSNPDRDESIENAAILAGLRYARVGVEGRRGEREGGPGISPISCTEKNPRA